MTTVPTTPAATERASGARMGAGAASLPRAMSDDLHPWVRAKFLELWDALGAAPPDPF